ncbi:MAG: hypothetical protein JOY58_08315 [Solirubrobacterales bacterium]|nr:hypothetical protein [Solirubrobacterales bacterium]
MHLLSDTGERVLVIGANGALGSLTARAFERAGWEVLRGSRTPGGHGDWRQIDLDLPETVTSALEGVDVVIDTVPHMGLVAEQLVIERGGLVLNSAAPPVASRRKLRALGCTAAGTVVLEAGIAPGLTNLILAELLAAHPDADEIELVFTLSAGATGGLARAEWLHRHLTAVFRHETAAVPLPAPFGARRCLGFAEPERGWVGDLAGPRAVRSYVCFREMEVHDALLAGNERGVLAELPLDAFAVDPSASRPSVEEVAHWVCVRRGKARLAARTIRCAGGYRNAAHATVALAQALQDARARAPLARGLFGPQRLVEIAKLERYLAHVGIRVVAESV